MSSMSFRERNKSLAFFGKPAAARKFCKYTSVAFNFLWHKCSAKESDQINLC